jgi:hypothetical protein
METDPVSEMSCFYFQELPDDGKVPKILYALYCTEHPFSVDVHLLHILASFRGASATKYVVVYTTENDSPCICLKY